MPFALVLTTAGFGWGPCSAGSTGGQAGGRRLPRHSPEGVLGGITRGPAGEAQPINVIDTQIPSELESRDPKTIESRGTHICIRQDKNNDSEVGSTMEQSLQ